MSSATPASGRDPLGVLSYTVPEIVEAAGAMVAVGGRAVGDCGSFESLQPDETKSNPMADTQRMVRAIQPPRSREWLAGAGVLFSG
jgi:hypothetical protein